VETISLPSMKAARVGRFGPLEMVPDLLGIVPDCPLGDLFAELVGLWYAYVMKRERDRRTSAVKLHFTKLVNASMKAGNTSREKVSALRASKNLRTMPISYQYVDLEMAEYKLTHPE
jgi:hypothetical protein